MTGFLKKRAVIQIFPRFRIYPDITISSSFLRRPHITQNISPPLSLPSSCICWSYGQGETLFRATLPTPKAPRFLLMLLPTHYPPSLSAIPEHAAVGSLTRHSRPCLRAHGKMPPFRCLFNYETSADVKATNKSNRVDNCQNCDVTEFGICLVDYLMLGFLRITAITRLTLASLLSLLSLLLILGPKFLTYTDGRLPRFVV